MVSYSVVSTKAPSSSIKIADYDRDNFSVAALHLANIARIKEKGITLRPLAFSQVAQGSILSIIQGRFKRFQRRLVRVITAAFLPSKQHYLYSSRIKGGNAGGWLI
jgi:hypothetical protein